jgi:hypothetical protein
MPLIACDVPHHVERLDDLLHDVSHTANGKFIERVLGTRKSEGNSRAEFASHSPRSSNSSAKSTEQIRRKNAVDPAT